jgi:hypothetical protein
MADKIPLKLNIGPNEIREFGGGDTVPEAHLPTTLVKLTGAQTLVDKTLDPTTVASRLLAVGATPPRVLDLASTGGSTATNYDAVKLTTQAAGSGAIVSPVSSLPNANLKLQALGGSGNVLVRNAGVDMGTVVGTTGTQTLIGKTLDTPNISNFSSATHNHTNTAGGGTLSAAALPADVLYGTNVINVANKTLLPTNKIQSTLLESTGTVPALSVGLTGAPSSVDFSCPKVVANVAGGGAVLSVESSAANSNLILQGKGLGLVTTSNGTVVGETGSQILTNKTLTAPILSSPDIGNFTFAQHDHTSAAEGGGIDAAAISSGSFSQDRIAATGNRTGNYVDGLSSRILRSNGTASGSGGTAEWCERERVGQVKTETTQFYHPAVTAYQTFSSFQFGGSWNTLPDVLKETGTSGLATNTGLKGKTLRVTGAATVTLNTATGSARSIEIQLNTAFGVVLFNAGYIFGGTPAIITNTNYVVFQIVATWRGDTSGGAVWYTHAPIARVSDITTVARTEALMTANNAISGLYTKALGASEFFYLQMRLNNTAAVGENIELTNCMWEVLN